LRLYEMNRITVSVDLSAALVPSIASHCISAIKASSYRYQLTVLHTEREGEREREREAWRKDAISKSPMSHDAFTV
jgi:hypothetical protein